jgi:hypothetical protein
MSPIRPHVGFTFHYLRNVGPNKTFAVEELDLPEFLSELSHMIQYGPILNKRSRRAVNLYVKT